MNRVIHYVNGIMTFPGRSKNWNGRAVTWTHVQSGRRAEKVEYWCTPVGRVFGQRARARRLYETAREYGFGGSPWSQVAVGHSNGADVIVDMLRDYPVWPRFEALHLVCAACEADFERNGLNGALRNGRVGRVVVYVAERDWALRLAHTLPGKLLGYGTLGLHGPRGVAREVSDRVTTVRWAHFGHSTCWTGDWFEETLRCFWN